MERRTREIYDLQRTKCDDIRVEFTELIVRVFDYLGTFAFALNGAMAATRAVRLDIVGVVTLAIITASGGGVVRDVLLGDTPPAVFGDWVYLTVSLIGALIAFFLSRPHRIVSSTVQILDAIGLSLFCVVGTQKALQFGIEPIPAILLGVVTAVGGGTIRDMMLGRVPTVLTSELYAIPALIGATIVVVPHAVWNLDGFLGFSTQLVGAIACFLLRAIGLHFNLNAPVARAKPDTDE